MAAPTYVNVGTGVVGPGITLTPGLPASRVTNNLMISNCQVNATGKTFALAGAGWTIGGQINTGNQSLAWAWRLIDGTETAPVWSWTGSANCGAWVNQFTGNATTSIIGNTALAANVGTTVTATGLVTTADNSLIFIQLGGIVNQVIPYPRNYTQVPADTGNSTWGSLTTFWGNTFKSGSTSDAVSVTVPASTDWSSLAIEIHGTGSAPAGEPAVRGTQVSQMVLENYAATATNIRATQVSQQVLESYSAPATNIRATQVSIMVLRSVDLIVNTPAAFLANKNSAGQTLSSSITPTQITFPNVSFNVGGYFSGNAWVPPPGTIRLGGQFRVTGANVTAAGRCIIAIYKNGAVFQQWVGAQQSADSFGKGCQIEDSAGGADVYTLWCSATISGSVTISGANADTQFWGYVLPT